MDADIFSRIIDSGNADWNLHSEIIMAVEGATKKNLTQLVQALSGADLAP